MNIDEWLKQAVDELQENAVPTAQLDAEVLLSDALAKDRSWIHANPDHSVQGSTLHTLDKQIVRRAQHEPLAYIRGKQEFYSREFMVSPDTLTPRPETETMIELALEACEGRGARGEKLQVVDVGTGSGCIIITAALELSKISHVKSTVSYTGLDISEPALKIAKKNAKHLNARVDFQVFDLLKESLNSHLEPRTSSLILANLPYVPKDFSINLAASREPEFAIFGGEDGLDYYRELFLQLSKIKDPRSQILSVYTESLPFQHKKLRKVAEKSGFKLEITQDFIQVFTNN